MKKLVLFSFAVQLIFLVSGQTWQLLNMPDVPGKWTITGIHFTGPNDGWAVGYNYDEVGFAKNIVHGIILQYKDGTWKNADFKAPSADWTFHGVWFLNQQEGWAFGQEKEKKTGLLMHYKNGLWETVDLSFISMKEWVLYDVFFQNEKEGWAVGSTYGKDKPVLLHYINNKWQQEHITDEKKQTLLCTSGNAAGNMFCAGFREGAFGMAGAGRPIGSFIIAKASAGWEVAKLPMMLNNVICRDILVFDESNVFAVGWMPAFQSAPETGKILYFNGKKWSEIEAEGVPKEWNVMSIAMESLETGWAVGSCNKKGILIQLNQGKWIAMGKKTEPQVSEDWMLMSISHDGKGCYYAAGSDKKTSKGIILKYSK